jgi:hypothetical protein
MSVVDYFGLDDPESTDDRSTGGLDPVAHREPGPLAVVDDLAGLQAWTRRAEREDKDRVRGRLAELARTKQAARTSLVWLLLPGAIRLAERLLDLTPEIDGLVAGQIWIDAIIPQSSRPIVGW